jgi:hypothetical protein
MLEHSKCPFADLHRDEIFVETLQPAESKPKSIFFPKNKHTSAIEIAHNFSYVYGAKGELARLFETND